MVKKIEGALYKMTGADERLPKGTIVRLTVDDGTRLPFFKAEGRDICLNMEEDVKRLKPKRGDTVRIVSKKHTKEALSWEEGDMEKKGAEFTLLYDIDTSDDTFKHNGFWYHKKDLAVIKRPGVDF
jgi:hypothetical protein